MKASAPNWLVAGFQVLEKTFRPSAENHDEACWLVEIGDQDQDHQHQQAGRQRDDLEDAVAERPPLGQRAGGHGLMLLGGSAHEVEPIRSRWFVMVVTSRSC